MTITLRPLKQTDNIALYPIYSNKKITRPAGFLPFQFQADVNKHMAEFLETHTAIILDNQLIGVITSDQLQKDTISFGIMLHEKYWHQGYGKHATLLFLNQAKKQGIKTIYADCLKTNIASQKLLESCNFTFQKDFQRHYPDFADIKNCKLYIRKL